jgi:hypothetical protein
LTNENVVHLRLKLILVVTICLFMQTNTQFELFANVIANTFKIVLTNYSTSLTIFTFWPIVLILYFAFDKRS